LFKLLKSLSIGPSIPEQSIRPTDAVRVEIIFHRPHTSLTHRVCQNKCIVENVFKDYVSASLLDTFIVRTIADGSFYAHRKTLCDSSPCVGCRL